MDRPEEPMQGTAILIGAGPAGLTAALELERRSQIHPVVIEATDSIGGIARTVRYKGNCMDIGGHRFFSKSDRVLQWWLELFPIEAGADGSMDIHYQGREREVSRSASAPDPRSQDRVMLVRQRKSRIYFLRRFFDYPIRLTAGTLRQLGVMLALRCGASYLRAALLPRREERSLEDFLIRRFGRQLYLTFFKSYTEKVWGVPCREISAEWGAQRIKGLSLKAAVVHFLKKSLSRDGQDGIAQKNTETSLIERFLYPKFGPGQLWEHVATLIQDGGGQIHHGIAIDRVNIRQNRVVSVEGLDASGNRVRFSGDFFFSTMPVRDLIRAMGDVPAEVAEVAEGLCYRDFITVGLLVAKLAICEDDGSRLKDNWIYIQESDVALGRLQIFNNWSPWLVADPSKVWIGLEYFANESDALWQRTDAEMIQLAIEELARLGIVRPEDVEDAHVVRVPKTYPAYFGTYSRFDVIRRFIDGIENLYLIGRNGMHKYNNQDHSMLTAMTAVDNLLAGISTRDAIWEVNTEMEYHEESSKRSRS